MRALRNLWTRTTDLLTGSAARATAVQRIYVSSADPAEAEEEVVAEPVSTTPASQHHSPKRGPSTAWKSSTQEDVKLEVEDLPDDAPHVVTFSEDARNGYSGHAQDRERWLEATKIQAMTRGPDATRKELRLPDSSPERPEGLNPLWMRVLIKMMKGTSSLMKFQGIFGDNASSRICNRRIQRLPRLALSRPEMQGAGYALQTITTCSTLLWQITGGRQGRLQGLPCRKPPSEGPCVKLLLDTPETARHGPAAGPGARGGPLVEAPSLWTRRSRRGLHRRAEAVEPAYDRAGKGRTQTLEWQRENDLDNSHGADLTPSLSSSFTAGMRPASTLPISLKPSRSPQICICGLFHKNISKGGWFEGVGAHLPCRMTCG
ncbi:unnamed protein product [Durusdinium trenchii]|uniref:Uncharacterized protein n=1 Tax=Durusdinium trenchii TaxID=1381693 RepID=A0ABP0SAV2_9DINO